MHDRGMIKWAPFQSVVPTTKILYELEKERQKIAKPELSEDQKIKIEQQILEAYYTNAEAVLYFYRSGTIEQIKSTIVKIDRTYKKLYLQNHGSLYFEQILKVSFS